MHCVTLRYLHFVMFSFAKTNVNAVFPVRAHKTDAGMDLSSCESVTIQPRSKGIVETGIAVIMPDDCYGRVAPRSGLAVRNAIDVLAGVVDESYANSIKVVLFNHSDTPFQIQPGDRIAQLIFEKIYIPNDVAQVSYEHLQALKQNGTGTDTTRGMQGFGSTGV